MSVTKLLSRIVAPDDILMKEEGANHEDHEILKNVHDHTYGITSDPLTQFAVVLSALIHDVDHTGVPNAQLVKEEASIASIYKGKSVAEQNSVGTFTYTLRSTIRWVSRTIVSDHLLN